MEEAIMEEAITEEANMEGANITLLMQLHKTLDIGPRATHITHIIIVTPNQSIFITFLSQIKEEHP